MAADQKITELTELTTVPAYNDLAVIVDVSDTSMASTGSDKKVKYSNLSNLINVKSYGAIGDGLTDDTAAIQSALTAAATAGGGIVFLPLATYVVSNLTIDSYVELWGAGRGTMLLAKSGSSGYMVSLAHAATTQRTAVRNLTLKPNTGTLGGISYDNTGFPSSPDSLHSIEDVVVLNAGGIAFYFNTSVRELRVANCYALNTGSVGFYVDGGCTDSHFTDCTTGASADHGWYLVGNNNSFVGCKSFYAGYNGATWDATKSGFYLAAPGYGHLVGCEAQQNSLHGFDLQSATHCTITGCEADTNSAGTTTGVGINTNASTHCVVVGCSGGNNGGLSPGAQKYGLQVNGTQTGTQLIGNSVTGSSGDFNYVGGSGYILLGGTTSDLSGTSFSSGLTLSEGSNFVVGSSTGSKIGTATTQKVAFYNSTPVVQPNTTGTTTGFTAGAGTAVVSGSTFTGNTGSTAYTIGDVINALKILGLLAS